MTLAEKVKAARQEKGWSIAELARRANLNSQLICAIQQGITLDPRLSTITRLARTLEKPLEYFVD